MVKILHAAQMLRPAIGVVRQMEGEEAAAQALGIPWEAKLFCPSGTISHICVHTRSVNRLIFMAKYYAWLLRYSREFDALVLRYSVCDPLQAGFVRAVRKPIFLVHHTLEGPELGMRGGWSAAPIAALEAITGTLSIRGSTGIIGVTDEIVAYERGRSGCDRMPAFVYPNGVSYDTVTSPLDTRSGDVPELVFAASYFYPWHGADMLVKSAMAHREAFVLHLVGDFPPELAALARGDERIRFHGKLRAAELEAILTRSWVGLSSFGLGRKSMEQACTLKVREYLKAGIPVYSGHRDVFPRDAYFYRFGPADTSAVLAYAREVRGVSREAVSSAARRFIDKEQLLAQLYESIDALLDARRNDSLAGVALSVSRSDGMNAGLAETHEGR